MRNKLTLLFLSIIIFVSFNISAEEVQTKDKDKKNTKLIPCTDLKKGECQKAEGCKWFESEKECSGDRKNPYRR